MGKTTAWLFCSFCHLQNSKRLCIFKRTSILDFSACYSKSSGYFSKPIFSPCSSKNTYYCVHVFRTFGHAPISALAIPLPVTRAIMPLSHSSPTAFTLKYLPLLVLQINFCQPLVFFHICWHTSTPMGAMT